MTLLPPNSTRLERNLEKVTERFSNIETPLRTLWNPDTCPEQLLPWLAWSLGVESWKSYWPLKIKRSILKNAIDIKRQQGTTKSVRDIVQAFGAPILVKESWQLTPPGAPLSFTVLINVTSMGGEPVTEEFQQDIIDEITRTKPVRSRFTVTAGLNVVAHIALGGAAQAAIYKRLELTDE